MMLGRGSVYINGDLGEHAVRFIVLDLVRRGLGSTNPVIRVRDDVEER